jgi:hypothetical protein
VGKDAAVSTAYVFHPFVRPELEELPPPPEQAAKYIKDIAILIFFI